MPATPVTIVDSLAGSLERLVPAWPDARLCVALSGGVDSVVLLHAACKLAAHHGSLGLRAIHVDHGLQPASTRWAARCRELCDRLAVPVEVVALQLAPAKGESVEAAARSARYAALAVRLAPDECLLTAHHADDQVETVLLQLFRGAGVAGLSAMPESAPLGAGLHLRPLLQVGRDALLSCATTLGFDWSEDPMNADSRFARAYLRHEVLPVIQARWPAVSHTIGRSARHFAAAQRLLETLADADGAPLVDEHGCLGIAGLMALPRERRLNVLRWWIAGQKLGIPSTARLESILRDVVPARDDAQPIVTWRAGEVRRYRGKLYAMRPLGPLPPGEWRQEIRLGDVIELPCGLGRVSLEVTSGEGLAISTLSTPLVLTFRTGGERLRPAGRQDRRRLRHLLQEHAVPPWLRGRLPLLWAGDRLVAVVGRWNSADAPACDKAPAVQVRWQTDPPG